MEIAELIAAREGENFKLHRRYVNPVFAKVLGIIGYDKVYTRGAGAYLYDREGNRYLDFLGGYGVFHLGRGHPEVKRALHELLGLDRPNLI